MGVLLSVVLSLFNVAAFARQDPGPKFGPEFTFTSPSCAGNTKQFAKKVVRRAQRHLVDNQPRGAKFDYDGYTNFKSPNGWSASFEEDTCVVEVKVSPMTVDKYERYARDIEDAVFVTNANEGLFPAPFLGGGHINIDFKYLSKRPMLLRNFLVDLFVNHVELSMGIFNFDTNNALPHVMLNRDFLPQFRLATKAFDDCRGPDCEDEYLQKLVKLTSQVRDPFSDFWFKSVHLRWGKLMAVNLLHYDGASPRIEIRSVRAQASMDVWIRQIRLLRNRLRYLEKLAKPIPIKLKFDLRKVHAAVKNAAITEDIALNPPISAAEALANFKIFAEESGEKIEDHLDYIWPAWQSKAVPSCEQLLKNTEIKGPE